MLAERREPVAWLLYSRLAAGELWLARDEKTAERLAAEHPGVPVLTLAELPHLEGQDSSAAPRNSQGEGGLPRREGAGVSPEGGR